MQITVRANWLLIPLTTIIVMLFSQWAMMGQWSWYLSLRQPLIMPSGIVFSAVWTAIYILTTACALIVFNTFEHTVHWYFIMLIFAVNALLNASWMYVFFSKHLLDLAILWAGMVALATWTLITLIKPLSSLTALLLAPYALWTTFATILATWIWWIN